jgi:hypothetical protein
VNFVRSDDFRTIISTHDYVVDPTGSANSSQNGRVERLNQSFSVRVAIFGEKPDLPHLRAFGSLVNSRASGNRPVMIDRHTFHGVFLGYTVSYPVSDLNVPYYDTTSIRIETAHLRPCQLTSSARGRPYH